MKGARRATSDDAEVRLRESEERYRLIVEGALDYAIFTIDPDGRIASWTPGAEAVFGWTAADVVGQPLDVTFVPEDREAGEPQAELNTARREGAAPDVRWHQRKDGARVFIEGTTRVLHDAQGAPRGFLKIGQDVTQRRQLHEALQRSEVRYRTLVENIHDYAFFLLDADGTVVEWSTGAGYVTGYSAEEVIGRPMTMFYPAESLAADEPARELGEAADTGRAEREGWRVRKGGGHFWVNEIATAVRDAEGRVVGFTKISRDLTGRRLAETAAEQARLAAVRDELRRALAEAEEGERRRLARDLHDRLGQHLTGFALALDDVRRRLVAGEPAWPRLDQLDELSRLMAREARSLALELRPPELDDLGLESAIESYVRDWGERHGIGVELEVLRPTGVDVPADVGSALYRIVQEALTNVARHAQATHVSVILETQEGEVRLLVEDDGRGFDADSTATRVRAGRRLGLAGMRERAALVHGTFAIESSPGAGAVLQVRVPLRAGAS